MRTRKTKIKKNLFLRVPMALDLLLGQLIYLFLGVIFIILAFKDKINICIGFTIGVALSIFIMVHMALALEDSVTMLEQEALKFNRKRYIIRILVLVMVFLAMFFLKIGDLIAALFGLMSLKVAAYLQPISHKIKKKIYREER